MKIEVEINHMWRQQFNHQYLTKLQWTTMKLGLDELLLCGHTPHVYSWYSNIIVPWLHRKGATKDPHLEPSKIMPLYCFLWLIFNLYLFPIIILNCETNSLQTVVSLSRNYLTWWWFLKSLKLAVVVRYDVGLGKHCVCSIFVILLTPGTSL